MNGIAWTESEVKILKENYSSKSTSEVAALLSKTNGQVYYKASALGLKKSEEYMNSEESGRLFKGIRRSPGSEFKPGQAAWNKGMKGLQLGGEKGHFKAGHLPHNAKAADGEITIREHKKSGIKYKWIRVALADWQQLHQYNWIKENGPIPEGHIVVFKTKDTMNCETTNLELISRAEHISRIRQSDGYIAKTLSGTSKGKYDKALAEELKKYPEILDLKRQQLKLKNQIKNSLQNGKSSPIK